jgi:hypothetical protein
MSKSYVFDVLEADDGSGDAIIQFTEEFIAEVGWKEGTVLNLRVEETPTGNVIIMTEKK